VSDTPWGDGSTWGDCTYAECTDDGVSTPLDKSKQLAAISSDSVPKTMPVKTEWDCYESSWETWAEWCPTEDFYFDDYWGYMYDFVDGTCTYYSCWDDWYGSATAG
jgi:hypothetical protein